MDGQQTYRVLRLVTENYKRLKAADVTPGRNAVRVAGKNRAGKSSLLDSIAAALGGKKQIAEKPVRTGAESAQVLCVLGDTTPQLLVKRTIRADGKTALEITSAEGYAAPSPQAILDSLCGSIAFDPIAFTRMDDRKQLETLRELVGLDFAALDAERKSLYESRTLANREAKARAASAASIFVPDGTPDKSVSVSELMAEQQRRIGFNRDNDKERNALTKTQSDLQRVVDEVSRCELVVDDLESRLADAVKQLADAKSRAETIGFQVAAQEATVNALEDQDVAEIQSQIVTAQTTNASVAKRDQKALYATAAKQLEEKAKELTEKIETIDAQKAKMLAEVKWPIDGLGFGESGVVYNDLPFSQASGAEQLAISFAMAAAAQPRLRVAIIRDASLLDADQYKAVCDMAEKYDMQVWLEVVGDAGPCGILIEDGTIAETKTGQQALFDMAPRPE